MIRVLCPGDLISSDDIDERRHAQQQQQTRNQRLLLGMADDANDIICITKSISLESESDRQASLANCSSPADVDVVGSLVVSDSDPPSDIRRRARPRRSSGESRRDVSVSLTVDASGRILECEVGNGVNTRDHVLLSYDPEEFVHSFVLEAGGGGGNEMVRAVLRASTPPAGDGRPPSSEERSEFGPADEAAMAVGTFLAGLFERTASLGLPKLPRFVESYACVPSSYEQGARRCRGMVCRASEVSREPSKLNQHIFKSFVWMATFDVLLGIFAMVVFQRYDVPSHLGEFLVSSAEWIGVELEKLLSWLVGAPAGLKLNRPLAKFLSSFFLHHVNLWRAYISLLQPLWGTILHLCSVSGVFGFTLQAAVFRDVISTMTVHVYCFYVYAARLYNLQLSSLASLWRLFRGRKWNSLRNRVDSTYFHIDSMFLGTLCFAILFFLLPTTVIFYVVFAALRLAVLAMQGLLQLMISLVEGLPLYWAYLRVFERKKITGCLSMSVTGARGPLRLHMKLNPVSLSDLIKMDSPQASQSSSSSSSSLHSPLSTTPLAGFANSVKKLLTGQLICPWIEK